MHYSCDTGDPNGAGTVMMRGRDAAHVEMRWLDDEQNALDGWILERIERVSS